MPSSHLSVTVSLDKILCKIWKKISYSDRAYLKGNGKKILSSYLKETPKQYIEVITEFLYLPYLGYFNLKYLVVRHLGYF